MGRLTRRQQGRLFRRFEPHDAPFRLPSQPDPRHLCDMSPLFGQPEQVPQHGEFAIDRRGGHGPAEPGRFRGPVAAILRDALGGDLRDRRGRVEPAGQLL